MVDLNSHSKAKITKENSKRKNRVKLPPDRKKILKKQMSLKRTQILPLNQKSRKNK
jgi:hypothetical protein